MDVMDAAQVTTNHLGGSERFEGADRLVLLLRSLGEAFILESGGDWIIGYLCRNGRRFTTSILTCKWVL